MSKDYKVLVPNIENGSQIFEGPFDLLLYFLKRDKVSIYDIPIAKITEEFLEYIRYIEALDLELAGEFILTATLLMKIKAQLLLPKHNEENPLDGVEDPRTELVQKLLEYKQYKEASKELDFALEKTKYVLYRENFEADYFNFTIEDNYKNATLFDLSKAFKKILDRNKERNVEHRVELYTITIEEQIDNIMESLKAYKRISFVNLIENQSKMVIAVTFLALLDIVRYQRAFMYQADNFDDIIITDEPLIVEEFEVNE